MAVIFLQIYVLNNVSVANVRVCLKQLDISVNRFNYYRHLVLNNVVQIFYGRFQNESCSLLTRNFTRKNELLIFITAGTGIAKLRQIYERAN